MKIEISREAAISLEDHLLQLQVPVSSPVAVETMIWIKSVIQAIENPIYEPIPKPAEDYGIDTVMREIECPYCKFKFESKFSDTPPYEGPKYTYFKTCPCCNHELRIDGIYKLTELTPST